MAPRGLESNSCSLRATSGRFDLAHQCWGEITLLQTMLGNPVLVRLLLDLFVIFADENCPAIESQVSTFAFQHRNIRIINIADGFKLYFPWMELRYRSRKFLRKLQQHGFDQFGLFLR